LKNVVVHVFLSRRLPLSVGGGDVHSALHEGRLVVARCFLYAALNFPGTTMFLISLGILFQSWTTRLLKNPLRSSKFPALALTFSGSAPALALALDLIPYLNS
jgi:hypothetical protein